MITALVMLTVLASCVHVTEDKNPSASEYPEGAIVLTAENLTDYFDVRVDTDVSYNYDYEQTETDCYVAFVPKRDYTECVGEVTFVVNTTLRQHLNVSGEFKAVIGKQTLRIGDGITNASYSGGRSAGRDYPYWVDEDTEGLTIESVSGYVIPGKSEEQVLPSFTEDQLDASESVFAEIRNRVDGFRVRFENAKSYHYSRATKYDLGSLYGEGKSVSGILADKYSIDKKNNIYQDSRAKYYMHDGMPAEQWIDANGLVVVEDSGFTPESFLEATVPCWELYDPSAVYVKESDNLYVGYTTLSLMREGEWRESVTDTLADYGITSRYNKFAVRYEISFDESSFLFSASVELYDPRYPVHFVDIAVSEVQKISDVDNLELSLYSPDSHKFRLPDNSADAVRYKPGMIGIDGKTEEFTVTVYSDDYEGYNNTQVENWLTVNITESGVYSFTPDGFIGIYGEDLRKSYRSGDYFEAGIYYIVLKSVLYGIRERSFTVEFRAYKDFGDKDAPVAIGGDGNIEFVLEGQGDTVVFAYTPAESGIYDFGEWESIALYVYPADSPEECVANAWPSMLTVRLDGGVKYLLVFECVNYGGESEEIEYNHTVRMLGNPIEAGSRIDESWSDIFLWGAEEHYLTVEISKTGIYYVEMERTAGQAIEYGSFYTEDGKSVVPRAESAVIDGRTVQLQALEPGRYIYRPSLYASRYFDGRARLVLHTLGVDEKQEVVIGSDGYVTLTTSELNTYHSSSSFYFEISEAAYLLVTEESDSFTLYDESGRAYYFSVYPPYIDGELSCHKTSTVLKPGVYTIIFKIGEYSKLGVKEAEVRLLPE